MDELLRQAGRLVEGAFVILSGMTIEKATVQAGIVACVLACAAGLGFVGTRPVRWRLVLGLSGAALTGRPGWAVGPPKRVEIPRGPGDGPLKEHGA